MAGETYTTTQLIDVLRKKMKFKQVFMSLFFRETFLFATEKVDLAEIPGDVDMAVYVSPTVGSKVLRTRGGLTKQFQPGYVKPKHEVNIMMTPRSLPDEDPRALKDPSYRRKRLILQNLGDEELAIQQVEEKQCIDAVLYGKYIMKGDQFAPVEVDMMRAPENNIIQAGAAAWSQQDKATFDPTDDIEAYSDNASGVVELIVFDQKGWALFRSFKAVKDKLDTRRGSNSELETACKDLGKIVSYKGQFGDVAIVVYNGQMQAAGVKQKALPEYTMVLGNSSARGIRTYGAIRDAVAQKAGIDRGSRFPRNWIEVGDPATEFTMVQSAPLMLLPDPNEFVSVQLA